MYRHLVMVIITLFTLFSNAGASQTEGQKKPSTPWYLNLYPALTDSARLITEGEKSQDVSLKFAGLVDMTGEMVRFYTLSQTTNASLIPLSVQASALAEASLLYLEYGAKDSYRESRYLLKIIPIWYGDWQTYQQTFAKALTADPFGLARFCFMAVSKTVLNYSKYKRNYRVNGALVATKAVDMALRAYQEENPDKRAKALTLATVLAMQVPFSMTNTYPQLGGLSALEVMVGILWSYVF